MGRLKEYIYSFAILVFGNLANLWLVDFVDYPDIGKAIASPCEVFYSNFSIYLLGFLLVAATSYLALNKVHSQDTARLLGSINAIVLLLVSFYLFVIDGSSSPSSLYFLTRECVPG